jgi:hypothetical protein
MDRDKGGKIMRFKVAILFLMAITLVPMATYAYEGGLTHRKYYYRGTEIETSNASATNYLSDGIYGGVKRITLYSKDSSTYNNINMAWYKFSTPQTIKSYKLSGDSRLTIELYNSNKQLLYSATNLNGNEIQTNIGTIENVTYVALVNRRLGVNLGVDEFDVFNEEGTGVIDTTPPENVKNLHYEHLDFNSFEIAWVNPSDLDFNGTKIYLNDVLKDTLDKTKTSYSFTSLNPNTTYTVKVISFDSVNNYSSGVTITVKTTIPPPEDIQDLQADAKYDQVKLSWKRPESEFFSHVNIYRKVVEDESVFDQLFSASTVSAATTSDGYTPMFETNGTYWTDLTVDPETTYSYKVTTENIEGQESEGVTIEVTTPPEPPPTMNGVSVEQDENGDYVVTWTSPTTGTVKVFIDGEEYRVVNADTKHIVIPQQDMKTNFFGEYNARLVPISENGTEGDPVPVPVVGNTQIDLPFSVGEFFQTVINILTWVAPFILLSFVFLFWRPIVQVIKRAVAHRGGNIR